MWRDTPIPDRFLGKPFGYEIFILLVILMDLFNDVNEATNLK